MSNGAITASVGWCSEFCTVSSVAIMPSVMDLSRYSWALTCWLPMAGPPARIWSLTPVSMPPWATSGPVAIFLLVFRL